MSIQGNLDVYGDVHFTGTVSQDVSEFVTVTNPTLELNVQNNPLKEGGLRVFRGPDLSPADLMYVSESNSFRVGFSPASLQNIATVTDSPVDGNLGVWNGDLNRFETVDAVSVPITFMKTVTCTDDLVLSDMARVQRTNQGIDFSFTQPQVNLAVTGGGFVVYSHASNLTPDFQVEDEGHVVVGGAGLTVEGTGVFDQSVVVEGPISAIGGISTPNSINADVSSFLNILAGTTNVLSVAVVSAKSYLLLGQQQMILATVNVVPRLVSLNTQFNLVISTIPYPAGPAPSPLNGHVDFCSITGYTATPCTVPRSA
ncbi:hypothetical protein HDU98_004079 [Podochytrium sp. JEL0797]|nr:hypothetical protein HDU98_004079 [Podochytrium sp. JEL0797]